jgi:hypothetical protein
MIAITAAKPNNHMSPNVGQPATHGRLIITLTAPVAPAQAAM